MQYSIAALYVGSFLCGVNARDGVILVSEYPRIAEKLCQFMRIDGQQVRDDICRALSYNLGDVIDDEVEVKITRIVCDALAKP